MAQLTQIHAVSNLDALHVIFIHGLGGDARSTWMHDPDDQASLWPIWVGEDFECNVWVAAYGAAISGWTDDAMHLAELGESLLASIQAEPILKNRSLVLIGHSLGGLVIKAGMTQAAAQVATLGDQQRTELLNSIAGIVFIGTPHQGSNLATIANNLRLFLKTNPQVTNMARDDGWLKLLNTQFRNLQSQRRFEVGVFYETKGVFIGKRFFGFSFGKHLLIVDSNSSDPGIAGVTPIPIEGDHIEIAKPKSRSDFLHKTLIEFLKNVEIIPTKTVAALESTSIEHLAANELSTRLRIASAELLSWPNTLPDGTWLQRPELDILKHNLDTSSMGTHFLIGDPGCGKSSLLVRLAQEKLAIGWTVLAIKADRLPPELRDRSALARHLDLGGDSAKVLRHLAKSGPVLVVIDQVDALADLVVQHSARLRVLLELVQDLSDEPGLHTVISCRTFEQRHDPSLRNLDASILKLELPDWSTVLAVLNARGLQAEMWNHDLQQTIRSPHALDIFLSLLEETTEPAALKSFHGLLEKQWETQVLSDESGKRKTTLMHLAKLMADREVLGLPLALVDDHFTEIQALAANGLLRLDNGPGRVEFRHQTLYEFIRARSFLETRGSLTDTVRAQQSSLRVRPQLWHALGYFRNASPEEYVTEIGRLWAADLRPHLKMLLIEFLGRQTVPLTAEKRLVENALTNQWFLPRFIGAAVGSPGWFSVLATTHLPALMTLPDNQAQMLLPFLRQALHFDADAVVALVCRHWLINQNRDLLSWQVLGFGSVVPQQGQWLNSIVTIAGRTPISEWAVGDLASVVSAAFPEEAPRIIAAWLARQVNAAKAPQNSTSDDETITSNVSQSIQSILEARHFHGLEAIAEASPKAFILSIWPPLLDALQLCTTDESDVIVSYRQNYGIGILELDDEESRHEQPLTRSIRLAVQAWAKSNPADYLNFADEHANSDLLVVHRLLSIGRICAANSFPLRLFDYLTSDARRLVLGPYSDVHKESISLINAMSPFLETANLLRLEALLINWQQYTDSARADESAEVRHRRLQWARQHRLRLLRAVPSAKRSLDLQRLIAEEERAFPNLENHDAKFSGVQWIGSPVSAEQMERASDSEIINLFVELTDESTWDHPRHQMKGGAIQASRELANLTKKDLNKALRIVQALQPSQNEIPVAMVLRELVPAGLPAPELYTLIAELEDKGFVGIDFRRDAAYAIASTASREFPVPQTLIDRMEHWLTPPPSNSFQEDEYNKQDNQQTILWNNRSMSVLPNGNYPILNAISASCLTSVPLRIDHWLAILELHVDRTESPKVWDALLQRDMLNLQIAEPSRIESLIDKLLQKDACIANGSGWIRFLAHAYHWASSIAIQRWITYTLEHAKNLQGTGELVALRHAQFPAEIWPRELAYSFEKMNSLEFTLGLAHSVAHLWHEPITRPVVHPILLTLTHSSDEHILNAVSTIFINDGFSVDAETREMLDAIVVYPNLLKNGRAENLPELLVKLTTTEPERICRVANALLDIAGGQMGNIATSWYLSAECLLDIALHLQDMGSAERAAGSMLFERMLEFNMPQAREMSMNLDKRMPVGNDSRAPARRRSRVKKTRLL